MKVVLNQDVEAMNSKGEKKTFPAGSVLYANPGKGMGRDGVWVNEPRIRPKWKFFLSNREFTEAK